MYGVGGSSDAISRDMNSLLHSSTFKHPADGEFAKIKQLISLDPYPDYDQQSQNQNQNQQDENQSSLLRYRSSPSSFFSNLLNDNGDDEFPDPATAASNHEPEERLFKRQQQPQHHHQQQNKSGYDGREFLDFLEYASPSSTPLKQESREAAAIQNKDLPPPSTAAMHGSSSRRDLPPSNNTRSYEYANQSNLDCASSFRATDSTSSNLIRQSSTPAGFLSSTTENGFAGVKDVRKGSSSSTSNSHISFSLGSSSSSRFLPQIAENENELNDSTFNALKRNRDGGLKISHNGENGNSTPGLLHHMSLPKTSSEMAAAENFFHFQQESSVPWKTRAKRGFATHPRSIAERMRRTRISERIKRLQELFPDMDKQTNTADMLDMAVEYIKDLQNELQTLNEARTRCKCSSNQLQSGSNV